MKRVFIVKVEGSEKELDDITAFEVCEAVRKEVGELRISVSEKKEED